VRALNALDWLIDSFPGTDYAEQAYLRKGDVVFHVQKQPEKALAIYTKGMQISRFYRTDFAERLGKVYLITGEYDQARVHFAQLINSNNSDLRDTGIYYSGLMLAFTKQYETARDTLTSLAEGNPSSAFTNDAIELAWIIEEGLKGEQQFLNAYVRSMQFELAEDTTHAVGELKKIVAQPAETPLRGRSLIRLGELYSGQDLNDQALEMYDAFVLSYPSDIRVADVKRKIGQVHERGQGNYDLALKTYEGILLDYPHYIFLDEVRADVNRIRAMQGVTP
jgi:tetratricopeptide (TPR) repeat protein